MASIDVRPGTQFGISTLATRNDPAGFREKLGFSEVQLDALCGLVRELIGELLAIMPAGMQLQAEERYNPLSLYAHSAPGRLVTTMTNICFQRMASSGRGLPAWRPVCIPQSSVDGLLVGATPEQVLARDPHLLSAIYHELIHAVVYDAFLTDAVLLESVALRFQREKHPYPGFYATEHPWHVPQFQGTTGFGTSDMSGWQRSEQSKIGWNVATAHALDSVPSDAIWNICSGLLRYTQTPRQTIRSLECIVPMQSDIRRAFEDELSKSHADAVYQTLALRPMAPGSHVMHFPQADGQMFVCRFDVRPNPSYGELDAGSQWNGVEYMAFDVP